MDSFFAYIEALESRINQLERRMNNMIREGEIMDVDYDKGSASMKAGDVETPMSSWLTRAGSVRDWNPVTKGERAIWLSPTGEMEQGLILPGGFSKNFPQNHKKGAETMRSIGDSTVNQSGNAWVVKVGGSSISVSGDGVTIKGARVDIN